MTLSVTGDNIQFPDLSTQASAQVGFKNRVIDGGFTLNQRVYVSGTALSAGVYAHDRWKAGASGCTYTFTQGSLGVNTAITITAGSLIQVIEGCNVAEGGTYVLSWTGTAQGRLNGGTYGASGTVTVTGWVAGTNLNVEFNTGTCGNVQLEKGSTATSFDYRDYGRELIMCQRYLTSFDSVDGVYTPFATGVSRSATTCEFVIPLPVAMRTVPTLITSGSSTFYVVSGGTVVASNSAIAITYASRYTFGLSTTSTAYTANAAANLVAGNSLTTFLRLSAEL